MRFDGPTLARAWLAVMAATGDDKNIGKTYKTISLEEHLRGVRMVASDGRLLLTAYVPDLEHHYDADPDPEEPAEKIHVVSDRKGRARSLLGYVLALSAETDPDAYAPGDIEVRVDFRQPADHIKGGGPVQPTLEGMEPDYARLTVPGRERLNIEIITDSFPDWRRVARHQSKRTLGALLPPEQLEKLARIRKHARGPLEVTMGDKTALVQYPQSDPHIAGVVALVDPEDPDVYQGDQEPDQPVDPAQTTIEEQIAAAAGDSALPDVLLRDAAELVVRNQLGSAAMLKRTLRIGQARADRLMGALEQLGIVGPADADSGRAREVFLNGDQVDQAIEACR